MAATTRIRRNAALGALGGAALLAYAPTKSTVTTRIVANGWGPGRLSPDAAATAYHLLETVPLLLFGAGLGAVASRYDVSTDSVAWEGVLIAATGLGLTIVFHWLERLISGPTFHGTGVPFLVAGYYVGWTVTNAGLFLCGVGLRSEGRSGTVPTALTTPLPASIGISAVGIALGAATFAGTHRIVAGVTWILVGATLLSNAGEPVDRPKPTKPDAKVARDVDVGERER